MKLSIVILDFPKSWKYDNFGKKLKNGSKANYLPDGELNPCLPSDRRDYSPQYYRGFDEKTMRLFWLNIAYRNLE